MEHTLEVQMSVVNLIACMSFSLQERSPNPLKTFEESSFVVLFYLMCLQMLYKIAGAEIGNTHAFLAVLTAFPILLSESKQP